MSILADLDTITEYEFSYVERFQIDMWDSFIIDAFDASEDIDEDMYDEWLTTESALEAIHDLIKEVAIEHQGVYHAKEFVQRIWH